MKIAPTGTPRNYLGIALIASGLLVLGAISLLLDGLGTVVEQRSGGLLFEYSRPPLTLLGTAASALAPLLALSRPRSAWLLAFLLPLAALVVDGVWPFTAYAGIVAVALVAQLRAPSLAWFLVLPGLVFPFALLESVTMTVPGGDLIYLGYQGAGRVWSTFLAYVVVTAVVLAIGHLFRRATLQQETLEADRRDVRNDSFALTERARLARDLHDVVAHHVSLIAVRAETAPYTVPDLSDGARQAFAGIAQDARNALDELRGVLGVLRRADGSVDLAPLPTAHDVASLVAAASAAGEVTYVGAEHLSVLGDATGHVVFRVVQEALTNARRHAPGAPVRISATPDPDGLVIRVVNPVTEGAPLVAAAGLTGMRERVEAVGGAFSADVVDGEVVVEAVLPS